MSAQGPIAVTGASGRLGRAVVQALEERGVEVRRWSRPDYDLDDPGVAGDIVDRDRPTTVIHCAAWTDVDGCARDPELAMRRNSVAVGELGEACARRGIRMLLVSTNEVFDGKSRVENGYAETDETGPINPYGVSKLSGEQALRRAFGGAEDAACWVVRTAWLFGPPGNDFPSKILAAADRAGPGESIPVVADEVGSPTLTTDLAPAIIQVVDRAPAGTYHLANGGRASRADLADRVLARCGREVLVRRIRQQDYVRASKPPAWAVLDTSRAERLGISLRSWDIALDDYLAATCPER